MCATTGIWWQNHKLNTPFFSLAQLAVKLSILKPKFKTNFDFQGLLS